MTLDEAIARAGEMSDAASDPAISSDRLAAIVGERVRVTTFAPNTFYRLGQYVTPGDASAPGPLYLCTNMVGQSGANAPASWPVQGNAPLFSGTAVFRLVGTHDGNPYDLRGARNAILREKRAIVAKRIDMASGNEKAQLSQQFAQIGELITQDGPEWPC